ncbi:MAG: hypothetical protein QME50_02955 [Candidatus Bathyarchaeota archaeon]|nr:hypothetical protein [Candidatus Bathyarchaeota archaeon]
MTKNEIRLQYSGFIIFASRLLSVVTGMVFVLMITRNVSEVEFGIWGNISDVLIYFTLIASMVPFWTTRFVARAHKGSAKTGLTANITLSLVATTIYLVPTITSLLQIEPHYAILYIVMSAQIHSKFGVFDPKCLGMAITVVK